MSRSACAWCTWAKIKDGICVGNVEKKTNRQKDRKMSNKSNKENKKKNQDNKISWFLFSKGGTCTDVTPKSWTLN